MAAYSLDLRERIVEVVEQQVGSKREIARLFGVHESFLYKLLRQKRERGDLAPLPHGGGVQRTLSADAAGSQAEGKLEGRGGGDDWQRLDPNLRLAQVQKADGVDLQQEARILFTATQDPDPSIRQLAYERLYEKGETEKVADLLRQEARSADSDRRSTAIESLGQLFAPEAADILRDATVDENTDVRHAAFQQLSRIDSPETVQVLRERLTYPDAAVRLMAIEAMAARGEASAREAAMDTLDDSDEAVQSKATSLLQELEAQEGGGT